MLTAETLSHMGANANQMSREVSPKQLRQK